MVTKYMGINSFYQEAEIPPGNLDAIKAMNGKVVEQQINYQTWLDDAAYRDKWIRFVQKAHSIGLKFILSCFGRINYESDNYAQKYNAVYDAQSRMNWISEFRSIIVALQPDGVNPMNEPPDSIDAGELKNFYIACVDSWNTVKPNLFYVIEGVGDFINTIMGTPRVDQLRTANTFYYSIHHYYSENGSPSDVYIGDLSEYYWNGDLVTAKASLSSAILDYRGVQSCIDAGVNIMFEEWGTHILAPNASVFMQDVYDFAKARNISVLWVGWWLNHPVVDDFFGTGLINDWTPTLSSLGEVLRKNLMAETPPPSAISLEDIGKLAVALFAALMLYLGLKGD